METIYFSLGIVTALVAGLLVIGVLMIIRLTKKQSSLENIINHTEKYNQDGRNDLARDIGNLYQLIDKIRDEAHRYIDERSADLSREVERLDGETHRHIDELNKYVDSRFDKTLDNVSKIIADHNKQNERKSLLKD